MAAADTAPEIDLAFPGTLVGSALFAKDYTFLIVTDKAQFTPEAFEKNPSTATGADVLFRSPAVADANGKAIVDLSSKGKEIGAKLKTLRTRVKVVLLGTMKNFPGKRKAVVEPYVLIRGEPAVKLTPQATTAKAGDKLTIKVQAQDLDEIRLHLEPDDARIATIDKKAVAAKSDNVVLTAAGDGKVTFVAQGLVGGQLKATEKIEITIQGPNVVLAGIGFQAN